MTPTPDTPTRFAAKIINEVLGGDMSNHASIAAHRLAEAGLLVAAPTENVRDPEKTDEPAPGLSGIPTEEQIAAEAWARFPELDPDYASMTYPAEAMRTYNRSAFVSGATWAAALTAAAGVAPQEKCLSNAEILDRIAAREREAAGAPAPQEPSTETTGGGVITNPHWPDGCPMTLNELPTGGPENYKGHIDCRRPEPAPSPDREKLIAEAETYVERYGVTLATSLIERLLAALAAVPDETELAEVIEDERRGWARRGSGNSADLARVVREWWEKK